MAEEVVQNTEDPQVTENQEPKSTIWDDMAAELEPLTEAGEITGSQSPVEETVEGKDSEADQPEDGKEEDPVIGEGEPESEELLDSMPDDFPDSDSWPKTFRDQHKVSKKKIKELRDELTQLKADKPSDVDLSMFGLAPDGKVQAQPQQLDPNISGLVQESAAAVQANQQQPDQQKIQPEFVFEHLAKIENGEAEGDLKLACEQEVGSMSPQDIVMVIERAKVNGFGDNSDAVMNLARMRLPEVQATWGQRAEQQNSASNWNEQRMQSMKEVAQLDGMQDKESDRYKGFMTSANELNEALPYLRLQSDAPQVIHRYTELVMAAEVAKQVPILQKENEQLKNQIQQGTSTLSSGQKSTISSGKSGDYEADFRAALEEIGVPD